ncbi:MAG TPA: tRNA (adenosine(37)-N6)-dimethylallyltransferase MiaA [Chloroflexota bacterium]
MAGALIAIVGPTAVGKTAAGLALAERIGGEIVSDDSRCVYRHMDIGTAKPTPEERGRVPHHLIDLVDPDEEYSVARFLRDAEAAIGEIVARGRRPIVVGGTGYWVRALLGGATSAEVPPDEALRAELATEPPEALAARLAALDPAAAAAIDRRNPRRLIRAIEVVAATGRPFAEARRARPVAPAARLIGLTIARPALYERIDRRYDQMVAAGWLDEVRWLLARGYRRDLPSMSGLGYREIAAHLVGELSLDEALARAKARCHRYARAQYGWFRLDDRRIAWVEAGPGADERIERLVGERAE